jgi:hypothetical protein
LLLFSYFRVTFMRKTKPFVRAQRFVALLMALYLFNFSIDSRDANPDHIAEDLSYNDIESVFEFSLECLLGIHNAVAEHDERDQDHAGSFDFNKIFYSCSITNVQATPSRFLQFLYSGQSHCDSCHDSFVEIHSPPPRG